MTTTATTATTVERAVTALLKWKEVEAQTKNPKLIPDDDFIYLILTLKKIPQKARTNPFKIPLPNPLHTPSSSEICLIIDDRPASKLTKQDAKKFIKDQSIPISKVIPLSKLKTDYKPFEAKRKLCDSYDLFLVDKRVVHFLPKLLGKHFFKKKKLPVPVDLTHRNWGEQVEKACSAGLLYMRTGTCCVMKVGKLAMEKEEIVNNVVQGIEGGVNVVPKNWGGVRSLHLKFADSVALPLYQSLPDTKLKIEGLKKVDELSESEAVVSGDEEGSKGKDGNTKRKKKGRIHEVRYMDVGIGGEDLESDDEMETTIEDLTAEENVGKKRKKGTLVKGVEEEVSEERKVKSGSKKGKKAEAVKEVEEEVSEEKKVKSVSKKGTLVKGVEEEGSEEKKVKSVSKKGKKVEKAEAVKGVEEEGSDEKKVKSVSKKGIKVEKAEGVKGKEDGLSQKGGDKSGGKKVKRKSEVDTKSNEELMKPKENRGRKRVAAA